MGHEAILANFDQPDSLERVMQGCDKVFLLTSPDEGHFEREKTIIDIAIESGIKQIVRISTGDANLSAVSLRKITPRNRSLPENTLS